MVTPSDTPPWPWPGGDSLRRRDEKLFALAQVAGRLVHDFNNLQAPTLGYITLLQEEAGGTVETRNYLEAMEQAARHAESVLERIMQAVRPQRSFHRRPTDLKALIEGEIEKWRAELPADRNVEVQAELTSCTVSIDARHWQLAMQALLSNAGFALREGGRLRLALEPVAPTPDETAELGLATGPLFRLQVQDSGVGMTAETLDHACEPLFTTRRREKVLGLGLTLVHGITRLHGGQLIIESAERAGTTVTLWIPDHLPAQESKTVPTVKPSVSGAEVKEARGKTVLVVDDDPMILNVVRTTLERNEVPVLTAPDGRAALAIHGERGRELGLVVTDVIMPQIDGYELVRQLRQADPQIPVLFISGDVHSIPPEYLRSLPGPNPGLLKKPFAVQALWELVRDALR
jgi:CheY-like chemotaxis protein